YIHLALLPSPSSSMAYTPSLTLFFCTAPAPPAISTLSLHDALPIFEGSCTFTFRVSDTPDIEPHISTIPFCKPFKTPFSTKATRSEEHTSELQSRFDLVCRLLLEKKKTHTLKPSHYKTTISVPTRGF